MELLTPKYCISDRFFVWNSQRSLFLLIIMSPCLCDRLLPYSELAQRSAFDPFNFISSFWVIFWPLANVYYFLGAFASIIAPFGGFFASGFKRAFKIKDFGDLIPGHGGLMGKISNMVSFYNRFSDRFDCHYVMATFVNVYLFTFIRTPSVQKLLTQALKLTADEQVIFSKKLRNS